MNVTTRVPENDFIFLSGIDKTDVIAYSTTDNFSEIRTLIYRHVTIQDKHE